MRTLPNQTMDHIVKDQRRYRNRLQPTPILVWTWSAVLMIMLVMQSSKSPCQSSAFQASVVTTSPKRTRMGTCLCSKENGSRRPPKKPRFTQSSTGITTGGALAPTPPLPSRQQQEQQQERTARVPPLQTSRVTLPRTHISTDDLESRMWNEGPQSEDYRFVKNVTPLRNNKIPSRPKRTATNDSAPAPPRLDKERMWKDRPQSSIEDLEERLSKRWGTDLRQWTANDDLETDAEDDEENISPSFQARPVKDPWLTSTAPSRTGKRSVLETFAKATSVSAPRNINVDENEKSSVHPSFERSPLTAFGGPKPDMDLSHLIADTPIAGLSEPTMKKKKRVEKQAIPLTRNGNPLYLTCDQAQQLFQEQAIPKTDDGPAGETSPTEQQPPYWTNLGIANEQLLINLKTMGCELPLAVQRNSCESILAGQDAVVGTYTGSGKTLAFLVPVIEQMLRQPEMAGKLRLIVVAPGRELASQITSVARDIVEGTGLTVQLAIGGTTFDRNLEMIRKRKPDILVGTPGRIAQLVVGDGEQRRGRLETQYLGTIVCDEFDALLEYKAHRDPTHALLTSLKRLKKDRLQSILCSATASDMLKEKKIMNLEDKYLRPGYVITMAEHGDNLVTSGGKTTTRVSRTVMHGVVHVPHRRFALETLRRILHTEPLPQQILIFVSDSRRVPIVVDRLAERGIIAAPLHGDNDKTDRAEVSKALRDGFVGIVVSTELAARGLDAPLLTHVINMDLPTDSSHYAHRAGRCGRGGRPGVVINLTTSPQERKVPQRMADELGIELYTIDVKNSKLNVVDPSTIELDPPET